MIKLHFDPKTEKSELNVDLSWAFENSDDFQGFLTNAGLEAQGAILAIISRMFDTIAHVTGGKLTEDQTKVVKEVLIQIACQDVDVSLFNQFRKEMGLQTD